MNAMSHHNALVAMDNLEKHAKKLVKTDLLTSLTAMGIPADIVVRLGELTTVTRKVYGKVYHIGKIILYKLWDFLKQNTNTLAVLAIGAYVTTMVGSIPFLGAVLAPIVAILTTLGFIVASQLDHPDKHAVAALVASARDYLMLPIDIINTVFSSANSKDLAF